MATLEAVAVKEARAAWPGSAPRSHCTSRCDAWCRTDHAAEYQAWVRRMGMWAVQYGTVLLAAAELDRREVA
jgi:hypothetical protein